MDNNSFYVLHLSDLHIRNEGKRKAYYADSLKKLIIDMLCQYNNLPDDQKSSTMQDISWGGFIKTAFETEEPIVFSANRQFNPIHTSWDDFITLVPFFNNSSHDIRVKRGINARRPIVSFGISLKGETCNEDYMALL